MPTPLELRSKFTFNMGKEKKKKEKKEKKELKSSCCEKYLTKGAHKRCKRCPCFDMEEPQRQQRFALLKDTFLNKD